MEGCTLTGVVLDPDAPLVAVDDRTADGQPHAQALRFGGEKGLEDFIDHVGRNAIAVVLYNYLDAMTNSSCCDSYDGFITFHSAFGLFRNNIERIVDQVQQYSANVLSDYMNVR